MFNQKNLRTDDNLLIEVVKPGKLNTGSGPDFFNAQLRIDGTLWAGNVEIHISSSEWNRHNHHKDPAYDSCILHVVLTRDATTRRTNGTHIPTVELKERFPNFLWENYLKLIGSRGWIPCQNRIKETDTATWESTIESMAVERLEFRSKQIIISLEGNRDNWDECFYQHLARNFGFQLNAMPFEMLARSLPLNILRKEISNQENIEALLFGQSGMLEDFFKESYPLKLQDAYKHLAIKYSLKNIPVSTWKLLRLRPVNFPAVRISQLSALLYRHPYMFAEILDAKKIKDIFSIFDAVATEYWNTHYQFNKESVSRIKRIGITSIQNLVINTCIPFIYSWGIYTGSGLHKELALSFLKKMPAEDNHLIRQWLEIGYKPSSAWDTQGLLQLKVAYCSEKNCLACTIGKKLINVLQ